MPNIDTSNEEYNLLEYETMQNRVLRAFHNTSELNKKKSFFLPNGTRYHRLY